MKNISKRVKNKQKELKNKIVIKVPIKVFNERQDVSKNKQIYFVISNWGKTKPIKLMTFPLRKVMKSNCF